ncbi:glycosyltransferase [Brachybacterium saurashtrense]|nr:glycosyltransferase [Brachybacterium saurashtrense]
MTSHPGAQDPRVVVLVYNDCANDSRVLKESATLHDAGYVTRIVAVERREKGHVAGRTALQERLDLERVPEFAIDRISPALAPLWRNLIRQGEVAPGGAPAAPDAAPVGRRAAGLKLAMLRRLRGVGERAYRTIALGTYWVNATRSALRFSPDVIHANDGNTLVPALAVRALSRRRVGIVYDSHELWRHRNIRPDRLLAPLVERLAESVGIRVADGVITVSPSIARWLEETYALPERPSLVRNVPAEGEAPDPSTGVLRERAGLAPEDKVIAYGGRITTSRGIEETIAALPHLPESVHFVLLGYGEPDALAAVRGEAARWGMEDRVHLVGAVAPDEVSRALADGDVAVVHVRPVCLSYRYALPNKLFESIRAGLPIAAADLPDMREVVEELGVGEVFRGTSAEDLAAALTAILEDPEPYRERALQAGPTLTWELEASRMLALYARVLERVEEGS